MQNDTKTIGDRIEELKYRKYNRSVSQQHMETAKRRDYFAEHFGKRGRCWKERMRKRALLRK